MGSALLFFRNNMGIKMSTCFVLALLLSLGPIDGNGLNCLQCDSLSNINCILQPQSETFISKYQKNCESEQNLCRTIVVNWTANNKNLRIVRQCGAKEDELAKFHDKQIKFHNTDYNIFDCFEDGCNTGNDAEKIKFSITIILFLNLFLMITH